MSDARRLGAPELDALVERVRQEAVMRALNAFHAAPKRTGDEHVLAMAAGWRAEGDVWERHLRELGEALLPFAREAYDNMTWPDELNGLWAGTLPKTVWDRAARLLAETPRGEQK